MKTWSVLNFRKQRFRIFTHDKIIFAKYLKVKVKKEKENRTLASSSTIIRRSSDSISSVVSLYTTQKAEYSVSRDRPDMGDWTVHPYKKHIETVPDYLPELFWANLQAWRVDFEQRLRNLIQAINHDSDGWFNHSYTIKYMGKRRKGESKKELEHQTSRMKNLL